MAMRRPGQFAPLSVHYYDDDKIMEAGELCEVLFVRMLAYAASQAEHEGWISDRVIQSRLGIVPFRAGTDAGNDAGILPGTDAGSRAEKLREVGLLRREGAGYRITSWLRWNRSAAEMGKERRRDRDRKNAVTSTSDGNDAGNDAGIPHTILPTSCTERPDQTRPVGADRETSPADAADGQTGDAADAAFTAWWSHVPKKVGRGQAKKAFKTALKKTDQQTLTDAMDAYAASVKDSDPKFIAHPATWLNGERWDDEPPKPQQQPQLKEVEYW